MGPAPIEGPSQVPTKLTFIYSKRIKLRDAGERVHDGAFPLPFHKEGNVARGVFLWSIIGNFMAYQDRIETNLLQLFAHPETSEWFSIISGIIFEVNIVAEREQA